MRLARDTLSRTDRLSVLLLERNSPWRLLYAPTLISVWSAACSFCIRRQTVLFKLTRIPDVVILMALGVCLVRARTGERRATLPGRPTCWDFRHILVLFEAGWSSIFATPSATFRELLLSFLAYVFSVSLRRARSSATVGTAAHGGLAGRGRAGGAPAVGGSAVLQQMKMKRRRGSP